MDKLRRRLVPAITAFIVVLVSSSANGDETRQPKKPGEDVQQTFIKLAPRLTTLERKGVALRWNGRPNGNIFLNRIAELLDSRVKGVKVIKAYEVEPETSNISYTVKECREIAGKIVALNPDIVIAAQGD
jgi:hypothetical protein